MTAILWSWAVSAVVLLAIAAGLGFLVNLPGGKPKPLVLGILVDNRGRFSLNRLQLVVWSIVVISLVSGVFFGRLIDGVGEPLDFTIPDRVLGLLGISVGTAVTVGAVKASKKVRAEENKVAAPPENRANMILATSQATGKPPFLGQVFMLEEGDLADDVVDVTKFQSFGFTIVLVVAYVAMAINAIVEAKVAANVTALPDLRGTFLVLIGISYAGYLGGKLPPQSGLPRT
jgi:hypothetical protein